MKIIEEIYDHIYGEIQQVSPEDEMFRKEIIRLLKPLEKREDWEQLSDKMCIRDRNISSLWIFTVTPIS